MAARPDNFGEHDKARGSNDMRPAIRLALAFDILLRLTLWCTASAISLVVFAALDLWPESNPLTAELPTAIRWVAAAAWFIVLFNVLYVAAILLVRAPIPTPREGVYPKKGGPFNAQLIWMSLLVALNKARYFPPPPGFLVFHISHLPPMCWLIGPLFGPKSRSSFPMEPAILDPWLVEIGRNVVIGYNSAVAAHYQERDSWIIKRTTIEDDAVIGGNVIIYAGVRVGAGAVIASGAVVLPNTTIGPNEFWGGLPAKKIRDLPDECSGPAPVRS